MKKFFYVIANICLFVIGMNSLVLSDSIRQYFSGLEFDVILTAVSWLVTTAVALIGIAVLFVSIHGVIYQATGFSLCDYALKKFGIVKEETDN